MRPGARLRQAGGGEPAARGSRPARPPGVRLRGNRHHQGRGHQLRRQLPGRQADPSLVEAQQDHIVLGSVTVCDSREDPRLCVKGRVLLLDLIGYLYQ